MSVRPTLYNQTHDETKEEDEIKFKKIFKTRKDYSYRYIH